MTLNILSELPANPSSIIPFKYKGVTINLVNENSEEVDLVFFQNISLPVDYEGISLFIESIKNHEYYNFCIQNPNIPKSFIYPHEYIHNEVYDNLIGTLCEVFNTIESKILIFDTRLHNLSNRIYHPLENKFKQFDFFDYSLNPEVVLIPKSKFKKFTCLINKVDSHRFRLFDTIISSYKDDIVNLRNENNISFRNATCIVDFMSEYRNNDEYKKFVPLITSKILYNLSTDDIDIVRKDNQKFYDFIPTLVNEYDVVETLDRRPYSFLPNPKLSPETFAELGELKHNEQFFQNLDLPWLLGYQDIEDGNVMFFDTLDIYSNSYFSIIGDNYTSESKEDSSFTEKLLIPMIVGNLPFLANVSFYYEFFEEVGFDFSYLKELFDIDYKNMNTLDEVFENVEKFISYFRNNSLDRVKEDYNKFKHIADSNQKILKQIWIDKEPTEKEVEFLNNIKQEKYKL